MAKKYIKTVELVPTDGATVQRDSESRQYGCVVWTQLKKYLNVDW